MQSGDFPPLPTGETGPTNLRDGEYAGPRFPSWGDTNGDFGKLIILRLAAENGSLPAEPFLLRQSVESYLKTKVESAYPESRGVSYVIKLRNPQMVDKLLKMDQLANGFKIKVTKHPVLNTSKCVISCAESTKYNADQIVAGLQDQGVIDCRKITRKVPDGSGDENGRVPTSTIILTLEGTTIPQHISFGWIRCKTRPYYPSPMLCFACFEFGHTRMRCQKQDAPVCGNCSKQHALSNDSPCTISVFCKRCNTNDHALSSRKCPVYANEEQIQHIRIDMGISYPQAKRTFEQQNRSQTMASVINDSNNQRFNDLTSKFDKLLVDMGKKDAKIDALIAEIQKRDLEIEKRDKRIAKLENHIKSKPNHRLDVAQQYGTIQDLVDKVHFLEAELAKKSKTSVPAQANPPTRDNTSIAPTTTQLEKNYQPMEINCATQTMTTKVSQKVTTNNKIEKTQKVPESIVKKKIAKADNVKHLPKRLKGTATPMYISDSEVNGKSHTKSITEHNTTDFNFSSEDESMDTVEEFQYND